MAKMMQSPDMYTSGGSYTPPKASRENVAAVGNQIATAVSNTAKAYGEHVVDGLLNMPLVGDDFPGVTVNNIVEGIKTGANVTGALQANGVSTPLSIAGGLASSFLPAMTDNIAANNLVQALATDAQNISAAVSNGPSGHASQSTPTPSAVVPSGSGTAVAVPNYLYADLAKAYGMDASTAYQEALSNTSYQRAMADLKAAGINPIMAVSGLSPAGGVYGASAAGGNIFTGVSSAKQAHTFYSLFSNLGTAIGAILGKGYTGAKAGQAIGTIVGNIADKLAG